MSSLRDPAEYVSKAEHRWAGHIVRRTDDRWTLSTLERIPRKAKRPRRMSPTRCAGIDQLNSQLVIIGSEPRERLRRGSTPTRG
ncbi:unnamed protein product [Strongylus vulgaris]|uniref:Uncharacterized protein n=1 Tax=Strongylus vulgaris TaxID=40348 RepID=A0A3P7JBA3_STRVU|nr:unnamed protein product [Strongylus vulgaris]